MLAGVESPAAVRAGIRRKHLPWFERREYRLRLSDQNYLRTITGRWCQLRRHYPDLGTLARIGRIPSFMQEIWARPTKWKLLRTLVVEVLPAYLSKLLGRDLNTHGGNRADEKAPVG